MLKDHSDSERENLLPPHGLLFHISSKGSFICTMAWREKEREMFYLTTHSTHFIYGYMASDIWLRTILILRKETRCRHMGYSFRLAARVLLYAPSQRQDNTYHSLCYTSRGAMAGARNTSHREEGHYHGLCYTSCGALAGMRSTHYTMSAYNTMI